MKHDSGECVAELHVTRERNIIWARGAVVDNRPHKHHALQLTWSAPGSQARLELDGATLEGGCLVVDGGVTHRLELTHGLIGLVDSESSFARRVRTQCLGNGRYAVVEGSTWNGNVQDAGRLADEVAGPETNEPTDTRVRAVLDWLDELERVGRWVDVSLEGALRRVHLSESRFLHLFSQEVGTPWRTYLVWRRALVSMTLAALGRSLTEAAHAAGYADSAHLSRQLVSLFGVTPSALLKISHFVQS